MIKEEFILEVASRVPAYSDFLKSNALHVEHGFESLKLTNKKNYLLQYPIEQLCWDGNIKEAHIFGASSGFSKSGTIFWPKRPQDEANYLEAVEASLVKNYTIDKKSTLVIICLAFGSWIGGMQIASNMRQLASLAKYDFSVATPGLNLREAVEIYKRFSSIYEQTLFITNPSNINLIIAIMKDQNILRADGSTYFPVVGEYFSEQERKKVAITFGHSKESPFCVWTGYGSADTGDLGIESESTIKLRKFFDKNPHLTQEFFDSDEAPMIFVTPPNAYLEIIDENIVVTKDQLIPLVRYNTLDRGGLLQKKRLEKIVTKDLYEALPENMLYVFGRASDSIIFYGTNLMISDIKSFLLTLDESFKYGGLFEIKELHDNEITTFEFTIFITCDEDEQLTQKYYGELLKFLKSSSLEFDAKYDILSSSVKKELIVVKTDNIQNISAKIKHHYIVKGD